MIWKCAVEGEVSFFFTEVLIDLSLRHAYTRGILPSECWSAQSRIDCQTPQRGSEDWFHSERCQQDFFLKINYNNYHIYMHQSLSLLMNYLMVVFENKSSLCVLHVKWSRALSEAIKHHQCALDIELQCRHLPPLPPSTPPPISSMHTDQCYLLLPYHCRHSCVDLLAL